MDTSKLSGPFHKGGTIYSNDPNVKKLVLRLTGSVKKYIYVKPNSFIRLISAEGLKVHRTLEFISGLKNQELVFTGVDVPPALQGKIQTKLIRGKDKRSYKMEVMNRVTMIGAHRGVIVIHTNYKQKPELFLRVLIDIRGPIQVTPGRIHFGRLKNFEEARKRKRSIWIKRVAGGKFKITGLEYNKSVLKLQLKERIPGNDYLIYVSLTPEAIRKGKLKEKIVIHTNSPKNKTIEIPVFAEFIR